MRICVLGSGSAGNALVVEGPQGLLLFDAGLSWREAKKRAAQAGFSLEHLRGVILSHEHADHVRGLDGFVRRQLPVAASPGTLRALGLKGIPLEEGIELAGIRLYPFALSHDATQPVGFRLESDGLKVGIATDLGEVTDEVLAALRGCRVVVLEANHDLNLLLSGPYPWPLKLRILGPYGHLSNEEAGRTLALLQGDVRAALLAHLSQENNTPALAYETVACALEGWKGRLYLAYPDRPSAVIS